MPPTWRVAVDVTIQSGDDVVGEIGRNLGAGIGSHALVEVSQEAIKVVLEVDAIDEKTACEEAEAKVISALTDTLAPHAHFEVTAVSAELLAPA